MEKRNFYYLQLTSDHAISDDCWDSHPSERDLEPVYDYHKSFYGKATIYSSGHKIFLQSYNTFIFEVDEKKKIIYTSRSAKCSATTRRHTYDFLAQTAGIPEAQRIYSLLD